MLDMAAQYSRIHFIHLPSEVADVPQCIMY